MKIPSNKPVSLGSRCGNKLTPAGLPAILLAALSFSGPIQAQEEAELNSIARAVADKGVSQCLERVNQLTNYIGFGQGAGANLLIPNDKPDQRIVPIAMEILTPQTGAAYVSATFAPTAGGGCGATYDAVAWWPKACEEVASTQFGTYRHAGVIREQVEVLHGGDLTRVFLMPAGEGCMSIKKEQLF